jgi:hypothetical protein
MRYLLRLITFLIFLGCEDKITSQLYDKSEVRKNISSISLSETNTTLREIISKAAKKSNFHLVSGSPYVLEFDTRVYSHKCNNPNSSAYNRTYDGFVQLRLLKNFKKIYICQKDYHGEFSYEVVKDLLDRMKRDLEVKF